jgi:predicted nucleic acid-binding protein
MSRPLVLDTNVLSSFAAVGWLESVGIWNREILATERVWEEFLEFADRDRPEWLSVEEADLEQVETDAPGALSIPDWSCLALCLTADAILITNDRAMHSVAEHHGVPFDWGTRFLLDTFEQCGLSKSELEDGRTEYVADLGLPDDVDDVLRNAEK